MTRFNPFAFCFRQGGIAVLLATLFTPGCQTVFGTYSVGVDNAAADAGTGGTTASTQHVGGAAQGGVTATGGGTAGGGAEGGYCDGSKVYTCVDTALLMCVNQKWKRNDTCEKVAFCNVTTGKCDKCGVNERQCGNTANGGSAVFVCADPQVGFTLETTCDKDKGQYCADDVKRCVLCEANETHCVLDDAGLPNGAETCSGNRSGWDATSHCIGGCQIVDGKRDICPNCIDGNTVCQSVASSDTVLVRTCVHGTWTTTDTCTRGCIEPTSVAPAACQ